jgi:eukaryotic-like serine/threonine-protein kinase
LSILITRHIFAAWLISRWATASRLGFQKLPDHPGVVGRFVTGALAQLQLARAQAMTGDKIAARPSYEKFLSPWKDADSDIPIYRQAKAEYSRLD